MLERSTLENPRTFLSTGLADHQDKLHFQGETLSQNHKVKGHRGTQYYQCLPVCIHVRAHSSNVHLDTLHTQRKKIKVKWKIKNPTRFYFLLPLLLMSMLFKLFILCVDLDVLFLSLEFTTPFAKSHLWVWLLSFLVTQIFPSCTSGFQSVPISYHFHPGVALEV